MIYVLSSETYPILSIPNRHILYHICLLKTVSIFLIGFCLRNIILLIYEKNILCYSLRYLVIFIVFVIYNMVEFLFCKFLSFDSDCDKQKKCLVSLINCAHMSMLYILDNFVFRQNNNESSYYSISYEYLKNKQLCYGYMILTRKESI